MEYIAPGNTMTQGDDSREYFSWERFFTSVLIERTKDSYLSYRKTKLNEVYLHENNKKSILKSIEGVKL